MEKKGCNEKVCKRCGWCCNSLAKEIDLNPEEDERIKRALFAKTGVIYLRRLSKFYLSLSLDEKEKMESAAKKLGINIEIVPNKLIFDKATGKVFVYDYYLNHDSCPLCINKSCADYENRPSVCRSFPAVRDVSSKEIAEFVKRNKIIILGTDYSEAFDACIKISSEGWI